MKPPKFVEEWLAKQTKEALEFERALIFEWLYVDWMGREGFLHHNIVKVADKILAGEHLKWATETEKGRKSVERIKNGVFPHGDQDE